MKIVAATIVVFILSISCAWAGGIGNTVEVSIITDSGRTLPMYPVKVRHDLSKVYAEAVKGGHFHIQVANRLNRRVGLVIAVDGRNIISGNKSWLTNNERMYILEPYGSGEFAGWRTAQDRINRFYFTDVPYSYASAFGDESAMGVIAVAVYPEVPCYTPPIISRSHPSLGFKRQGNAMEQADKADAEAAAPSTPLDSPRERASRSEQALESAGTGYGRDEYSPSQTVAFEPEKRAVETIYLKYEWRSTLCKLGVIACERPLRRVPNRLWDDYGYAPAPPAIKIP